MRLSFKSSQKLGNALRVDTFLLPIATEPSNQGVILKPVSLHDSHSVTVPGSTLCEWLCWSLSPALTYISLVSNLMFPQHLGQHDSCEDLIAGTENKDATGQRLRGSHQIYRADLNDQYILRVKVSRESLHNYTFTVASCVFIKHKSITIDMTDNGFLKVGVIMIICRMIEPMMTMANITQKMQKIVKYFKMAKIT